MLDIYTLCLSWSRISDGKLTTIMFRVPARCDVLLEDLDAASTRSITRDWDSTSTPGGDKHKDRDEGNMGPMVPPNSPRSRRNPSLPQRPRSTRTTTMTSSLVSLDPRTQWLRRGF
ncbi:hypothetical protein FIBSPDRAFT_20572 [Athelia psychrophila]|uniref:Uncharacterized protein n=1 Tax=Athelia psychrophila TaxID=1759441 RepID=A0A166UDN3_9AGAM|nr:hypothetical protein FIBSPDRAFT_20572 [Fibularhizoctonia sp. CBS 109695]